MPEVVREAVEGAEPVRIIFLGGRFGVKKKGGFNRISRMQTAGGEIIGCGNLLWIFGWVIRP